MHGFDDNLTTVFSPQICNADHARGLFHERLKIDKKFKHEEEKNSSLLIIIIGAKEMGRGLWQS